MGNQGVCTEETTAVDAAWRSVDLSVKQQGPWWQLLGTWPQRRSAPDDKVRKVAHTLWSQILE